MPGGWIPSGVAQILVDMQSPELRYAYDARTEFNDGFSLADAAHLARTRAEARMKRKAIRRIRYQRMMMVRREHFPSA